MKEMEILIKGLCIDYAVGFEKVIKDSKTLQEFISAREQLKRGIVERYQKRISAIPESERKVPAHFDILHKCIGNYSRNLNSIINEEKTNMSALKERTEELTRATQQFYKTEMEKVKKSRRVKGVEVGVSAALILGGIFTSSLLNRQSNSGEQSTDIPTVSGTMPQESDSGIDTTYVIGTEAPEVRSYQNKNGEFLRLDNIVDINTWAYNEVKAELEAYQKAHPNGMYDFDMSMISPETGCALMIAESSGGVNCNTHNPNFQGPYSIGVNKEYIDGINVVAQALTGENCIDPTNIKNDVQDPRLACKAYLYNMIENYRQLKYALKDAGLENIQITKRLLVDSFWIGATGAVREITNGEDHKRPYADRITQCEDVFVAYAISLREHPEIRQQDKSHYGTNAHNKLNKITEKYSNTPTRGGNSSADEME